MALVVIGGTFIAGHIPDEVPLLLPTILAVVAAALLLVNVYLTSTIKGFAWAVFRQVFGWSLVGYGVIAGLLMFVFIRDDIPGDVMTFLIAMLVIFADQHPVAVRVLGRALPAREPVASNEPQVTGNRHHRGPHGDAESSRGNRSADPSAGDNTGPVRSPGFGTMHSAL